MTRKDYVMIAAVFARFDKPDPNTHDLYTAGFDDGVGCAALKLADALQADNPRFDRERFLKACGVTR